MYCQVCGAPNRDDQEYCVRCHQKLLVLSGALRDDEETYEESPEESFSFDEHLLERISILEEAVKRTAETVRQLLGALHKQEKNILINQTGLSALRDEDVGTGVQRLLRLVAVHDLLDPGDSGVVGSLDEVRADQLVEADHVGPEGQRGVEGLLVERADRMVDRERAVGEPAQPGPLLA